MNIFISFLCLSPSFSFWNVYNRKKKKHLKTMAVKVAMEKVVGMKNKNINATCFLFEF